MRVTADSAWRGGRLTGCGRRCWACPPAPVSTPSRSSSSGGSLCPNNRQTTKPIFVLIFPVLETTFSQFSATLPKSQYYILTARKQNKLNLKIQCFFCSGWLMRLKPIKMKKNGDRDGTKGWSALFFSQYFTPTKNWQCMHMSGVLMA